MKLSSCFNKLNHWKRLAVVLTGIYFLGALVWGLNIYIGFNNPSPSNVKRTYLFVIFTPFDETEVASYKKWKYEQCSNDGMLLNDKRLDNEGCKGLVELDLGQMAHKSPNYIGFLILLILAPMLFWLFVWLLIKIVKWVLAGKSNA
ncbi:hypothetical protein [uncultured Shewanella sp.]|uniref:hypothetical protein n=1 Tax=uncultured Shewanella sp. TaxID=173975 RepID=UPI002625B932|nr:hypothetical protein [uncultured Shewanella sp.]